MPLTESEKSNAVKVTCIVFAIVCGVSLWFTIIVIDAEKGINRNLQHEAVRRGYAFYNEDQQFIWKEGK